MIFHSGSPLLSVCIPVYNGEQHIIETVESVIGQRYDNLEVIIQDNASMDKTWSILQDLSRKYPQLSLQRNERNVGMAPNWNLAINRAQGDYVMLLSADDLLAPGFFSACLDVFARLDIDVVTTNHFLLRNDHRKKRKMVLRGGAYTYFAGTVLLLNPFSINFTLFKRGTVACLKREGNLFRESFFVCDYDLWIRMALSGMRVHYIEKPLGTYRVHKLNLSRQVVRMSRQAALVVLTNKKTLKKRAYFAYRITLLRFMVRFIIHAIKLRLSQKRILSVLWKEFIS